jgi:hypothetical protein
MAVVVPARIWAGVSQVATTPLGSPAQEETAAGLGDWVVLVRTGAAGLAGACEFESGVDAGALAMDSSTADRAFHALV